MTTSNYSELFDESIFWEDPEMSPGEWFIETFGVGGAILTQAVFAVPTAYALYGLGFEFSLLMSLFFLSTLCVAMPWALKGQDEQQEPGEQEEGAYIEHRLFMAGLVGKLIKRIFT